MNLRFLPIYLVAFANLSGCGETPRKAPEVVVTPKSAVEVSPASAESGKWGDITGIVTSKKSAAPEPINIGANADGPACTKNGPLMKDDWVVHPTNKGLRDVYVWLEALPAKEKGGEKLKLPIHPELEKVPASGVEIDQPSCLFIPRAVALRQGQILIAKNSSPVLHNFKYGGNPAKNPGGNFTVLPGEKKAISDLVEDRIPVLIECSIHPWMRATVRAFDHPYFALTDANGAFTIKNAPTGDFRIKYHHANEGWFGGAAGKDGNPITIKSGENTVPAIEWETFRHP